MCSSLAFRPPGLHPVHSANQLRAERCNAAPTLRALQLFGIKIFFPEGSGGVYWGSGAGGWGGGSRGSSPSPRPDCVCVRLSATPTLSEALAVGLLECDLEGRLDLGAEQEEEEDAPV